MEKIAMPQNYQQLVSQDLLTEYCYKKAKLTKALENPQSVEFDMLYSLVAKEMAKVDPPLIIPYVEFCISAQCTLKCRDCANFMQHYQGKAKPMDLEAVKSWIVAFVESVDHIMTLRLMGGEPLMQKDFTKLFEFVLTLPKIQHIQIVSNATLVPKDDLLALMANNTKCSFFFSNYGSKLAPKYDAIVKHCLDHGVLVQSTPADISWFDMGDTHDRHLSDEQKAVVYQNCPNNCRHVWNGEFHHCPRSAHAKYLGLIEMPEQDYVPLLELDSATRRERIRKMYDAPFIEACNHCSLSKEELKLVPCAVQVTTQRPKATSNKNASTKRSNNKRK